MAEYTYSKILKEIKTKLEEEFEDEMSKIDFDKIAKNAIKKKGISLDLLANIDINILTDIIGEGITEALKRGDWKKKIRATELDVSDLLDLNQKEINNQIKEYYDKMIQAFDKGNEELGIRMQDGFMKAMTVAKQKGIGLLKKNAEEWLSEYDDLLTQTKSDYKLDTDSDIILNNKKGQAGLTESAKKYQRWLISIGNQINAVKNIQKSVSGQKTENIDQYNKSFQKTKELFDDVGQTNVVKIFDGVSEQIYDVTKDTDALNQKLSEMAKILKDPVWQAGDLRHEVVNSPNFKFADSLAFNMQHGGGSAGSGHYTTSNFEDVVDWMVQKGQDKSKGLYTLDLSNYNLLQIPSDDYYDQITDLFSSMHKFLTNAAGLKQYDTKGINNPQEIFKKFKHNFEDLHITYEDFSSFIQSELSYLKQLDISKGLDQVEAIQNDFIKHFTKAQGLSASLANYDDSVSLGSVIYPDAFNKEHPYSIDWGGNIELARKFYDEIKQQQLEIKASNLANDPEDLIRNRIPTNVDYDSYFASQTDLLNHLKEINQQAKEVDFQTINQGVLSINKAVQDGISDSLDSHSPSKEAAKQADNVVDGIINEVNNRLPEVKQTGENIGETIVSGIKDGIEQAKKELTEEDYLAQMDAKLGYDVKSDTEEIQTQRETDAIWKKAESLKELRDQYKVLKNINHDIALYENPDNYLDTGLGKSFTAFGEKKTGSGYEELKKLKKDLLELNPILNQVADSTERISKSDFEQMFGSHFETAIDKVAQAEAQMGEQGIVATEKTNVVIEETKELVTKWRELKKTLDDIPFDDMSEFNKVFSRMDEIAKTLKNGDESDAIFNTLNNTGYSDERAAQIIDSLRRENELYATQTENQTKQRMLEGNALRENTYKILEDIGLTEDEFILKLQRETEEVKAGTRAFQERWTLIKDGQVVQSFAGSAEKIMLDLNEVQEEYDKIIHTHIPDNSKTLIANGFPSPEDLKGFLSKYEDGVREFVLYWNNNILKLELPAFLKNDSMFFQQYDQITDSILHLTEDKDVATNYGISYLMSQLDELGIKYQYVDSLGKDLSNQRINSKDFDIITRTNAELRGVKYATGEITEAELLKRGEQLSNTFDTLSTDCKDFKGNAEDLYQILDKLFRAVTKYDDVDLPLVRDLGAGRNINIVESLRRLLPGLSLDNLREIAFSDEFESGEGLHSLANDIYNKYYGNLQGQNDLQIVETEQHLTEATEKANTVIEEQKQKIIELEGQVDDLRSSLKAQGDELAHANEEYSNMMDELGRANDREDLISEELTNERLKREEIEKQNKALKEQNELLEQQRKEAKADAKYYEEMSHIAAGGEAEADAQRREVMDHLLAQEKITKQLKEQTSVQEEKIATLEKERDYYEEAANNGEREIANLTEALDISRSANQYLETQSSMLKEQNEELQKKLEITEQITSELKEQNKKQESQEVTDIKDVQNAVKKKNKAFQKEESVVSKAVNNEITKLKELEKVISQNIPNAIQKKNEAFIGEGNVVSAVVNNEKKDIKQPTVKNTISNRAAIRAYQAQLEKFKSAIENPRNIITRSDREQYDHFAGIDISKESIENLQKYTSEMKDFVGAIEKMGNETKLRKILKDIAKTLNDNTAMPKELAEQYKLLESQTESLLNSGVFTPNQVQALNNQLLQLGANLEKTGKKGKSFFGMIGRDIKTSSARIIAQYLSIQDFIRYARSAVQAVTQLDNALTQLKIVSDASNESLKHISDSAYAMANALGLSTTEIVNSITEWRRLGYTIEDSQTLAQEAAKLSTGGLMDVNSATTSLISAMQAFKIGANEVGKVVDQYIYLGK